VEETAKRKDSVTMRRVGGGCPIIIDASNGIRKVVV
jgi:hypothetical protein